jgi:DNA-binding transcriptional ArsR family regulator
MAACDSNRLAGVLRVLASGTRVRIVQLLRRRALCVNALAARLDVTQAAVSQHLRIMRDAGLVIYERRGYYVHYRLDEETLAAWREETEKLLGPRREACKDNKGASKCAAAKMKNKPARSRKA